MMLEWWVSLRSTHPTIRSAGAGASSSVGAWRRREEFARVDRLLAAAQLEMQLRLADPAGGADPGDRLPRTHLVALVDQQLLAMRIGRDPAAGVLYQHPIAVAAHLVAGI